MHSFLRPCHPFFLSLGLVTLAACGKRQPIVRTSHSPPVPKPQIQSSETSRDDGVAEARRRAQQWEKVGASDARVAAVPQGPLPLPDVALKRAYFEVWVTQGAAGVKRHLILPPPHHFGPLLLECTQDTTAPSPVRTVLESVQYCRTGQLDDSLVPNERAARLIATAASNAVRFRSMQFHGKTDSYFTVYPRLKLSDARVLCDKDKAALPTDFVSFCSQLPAAAEQGREPSSVIERLERSVAETAAARLNELYGVKPGP